MVGHRAPRDTLEPKDNPQLGHQLHTFFMVYGSEAVLSMDLDYGAPRIRAYDEQGAEASHQDAMDQLDEAHDIALLRSAKYQ